MWLRDAIHPMSKWYYCIKTYLPVVPFSRPGLITPQTWTQQISKFIALILCMVDPIHYQCDTQRLPTTHINLHFQCCVFTHPPFNIYHYSTFPSLFSLFAHSDGQCRCNLFLLYFETSLSQSWLKTGTNIFPPFSILGSHSTSSEPTSINKLIFPGDYRTAAHGKRVHRWWSQTQYVAVLVSWGRSRAQSKFPLFQFVKTSQKESIMPPSFHFLEPSAVLNNPRTSRPPILCWNRCILGIRHKRTACIPR